MKIRNLLLIPLFCLVLIGPLSLFIAQDAMGLQLPPWLTAEDANLLQGKNTTVSLTNICNLEDISKGNFQASFEEKVTEYVPARASAIIGNAEWQRTLISLSNTLFNWECYPTFFSSRRVHIPEFDAVAYIPNAGSEGLIESWQSFANGVRAVAERYPEKNFVLYIIEGYAEASWNPAYELVSRPSDPSACKRIMDEMLASTENASVLTRQYETGEEYYTDFFTTDHHWNIRGAWNACDQICAELGVEAPSQSAYEDIPDFTYTGATARGGLDMIEETVFNSTTTFDYLTLEALNGTSINCADHEAFWKLPPLRQRYSFYDSYFDGMGRGTITGGSGSRTGLLIGNSFIGAIQRPLASAYESLATRSDLHPNQRSGKTLQEQIEESSADDVVFVANPSNYAIDSYYFEIKA